VNSWLRSGDIQSGLDNEHGEGRVKMAFVMVGIMIICCKQSRSFVAVIMMGNTVMVVIVDVIQRHRFIIVKMPMQRSRRSPSDLERHKEHQQDGEETTHGAIVTVRGPAGMSAIRQVSVS